MRLRDTRHRENHAINVLLVEDDPEDAAIFKRYAQRLPNYRIKVDHEEDPKNIDRCLRGKNYDLLFLDQRLGSGITGLEVLRKVRLLWPCMPVIILTGTGDEKTAVEMMKSGATDYLTKETFNSEILNRVVRYALEQRRQAIKEVRAQEALHESALRYRTLFESAPVGIRIETMEGVPLEANEAMLQMMGCFREEFYQVNTRDIYQNHDEWALLMERIKREGYVRGLEMNLKRRDGTCYEARLNVTKLTLANKDLLFTIAEDITDKKRLEVQLQHAQRLEALGTLAGGIAHNFNNLLMGIMGNSSLLLLQTQPESPHYDKLKKIEKLVDSGSLLTRQLLGYAREGRYEIRPISINRIVRETSETFAMTKKSITVQRDFDDQIELIKADQGQIEQVMWNLYVNAADAMPSGGRLYLQTRNVTDGDMVGKHFKVRPGKYVLVAAQDTGIGMDKATMERIFEPFFTTKGLAKGTGLGLASVYGIVKSHGGYIDVESRKGRGTTFYVYFPTTREAVMQEETALERIEEGKETLLLVDDEEIILDVGREMFEVMGYTVLTAGGGKEALELFGAHKDAIDLVILDMIMPDVVGGEIYDGLKGMNPGVKVLLSSGYSLEGQASEIIARGCDGFIQKPFDIKEVSHKIRDVLGAREKA